MGTVINKTTLEFQESVNNDPFPESNWIRDPDLSALTNVPKRHWKIVDGTVVEMDQSEKDAVDAALLPQSKLDKMYDFTIDTRVYINNAYAAERQQTLSVLLAEARQFIYSLESPVFTGSGLNDLTFTGTFAGYFNLPYIEIKIDSVGDIDTFSIRNLGMDVNSNVAITGNDQDIMDGLKIKLNAITGHTLGDKWILRVKRYTRINRANYILQALGWVLTVLNYHYTKMAQINGAATLTQLEAITWDFAPFTAGNPQVAIQTALSIQD